MKFSIMFFSNKKNTTSTLPNSTYDFILECAKFADANDFESIWTPERHFHEFGAFFPNPAITSAAIAVSTKNIKIRAGSLVSPLHHTVRIAEDWAMINNLSRGRVGISFGCGWNVNDFIFFPSRYEKRQEVMYLQIEELKNLWAGNLVKYQNGVGADVEIKSFPTIKGEIPIWITCSGNPNTFKTAGKIGANLLTHLINQDVQTLKEKISLYREERRKNGYDPSSGIVTLMVHTLIAKDMNKAKEIAGQPFKEYLRSAINLEYHSVNAGGAISGNHQITPVEIPKERIEELLEITYERYFESASLVGDINKCAMFIQALKATGIDEIACLLDFGMSEDVILSHLPNLHSLKEYIHEKSVEIA